MCATTAIVANNRPIIGVNGRNLRKKLPKTSFIHRWMNRRVLLCWIRKRFAYQCFSFYSTDRIKDLVAKLHRRDMYVYERVDNYRANGTPLWSAAVFHKSRAFTGDSRRHVFFFFFYFVSVVPNANKSILWRQGLRICFAAGCSALFAVLSWHFESVSDFMDYPGNIFRGPFATHHPRSPAPLMLHLIMIEDATLLAERSARAVNLKSIKYNPLRDVMVARPPMCYFQFLHWSSSTRSS